MKKFRFELERLLRLAQIAEEQRRATLIKVDGIHRLAERESKVRLTNVASLSWEQVSSSDTFEQVSLRQENVIEAAFYAKSRQDIARASLQEAKDEWLAKKSTYESLLRLKDRKFDEFHYEFDRIEQRENDEQGSNTWRRHGGMERQ